MSGIDNDDRRAQELADLGDPEQQLGGLPYPAGSWEANRARWHGGELTPKLAEMSLGKLPEQPDPRKPEEVRSIDIAATVDGYGPPAYPPGTPMTPLVAREADQSPVAEDYPYGTKVDAGAQSLVWALTASQHGTELLSLLHAKFEGNEDNGWRAPEVVRELRDGRETEIAYQREALGVAERLAGMWALVSSSQPYEEVMIDPESGE